MNSYSFLPKAVFILEGPKLILISNIRCLGTKVLQVPLFSQKSIKICKIDTNNYFRLF